MGQMGRSVVLGVTGLPCAGKSHAAKWLAEAVSGRLIKADEIGHAVLHRPEVVEALIDRFGVEAVAPGNPLETRRRLARVVFNNPTELAWLEALAHPLIAAETGRIIAGLEAGRPAVVEAALLFAAGMEEFCDRIVLVEASRAMRLERAARRGWDDGELARRERRIAPLFYSAAMEGARARIIRVRNDADDGAVERELAAAMEKIGLLPGEGRE